MILDKYEITGRCTEVAVLQQDRNDFLMRKFIIAKTVKGLSERSIRYYKTQLKFTLDRIGKTIDDITAEDIRMYLAVRQVKDKISKVTADNERRCLNSFFSYLIAEELITKNPMAKVDNIRCERRRKEAFTDVEVERIRNAAEGIRERAIVEVLFSTGCRVSELVGIKMNDIDENKCLVHGKGAKDRIVYLNAKAMVALEEYLGKRNDSNPYLFAGGDYGSLQKKGLQRATSKEWWQNEKLVDKESHLNAGTVEGMMRKIAKRAGVEKANPHKFRRTCATTALRRGMPIEQVSRMLGHESIATTQIYLDLTETELEQYHKKYVI